MSICVGEIEKKTLEHFYQNFNIRSVFVKTLSDKEKNWVYMCVCRGNRKNFGEIEYILSKCKEKKVCLFSHKKIISFL